MTLDLSVVNRIAAQCGINAPDFKTSNTYMALPNELLAFAQYIYEMGAAEQKEKDVKICEDYPKRDPGEDGNGRKKAEEELLAMVCSREYWYQRAEAAEARIKASQEQEPIGYYQMQTIGKSEWPVFGIVDELGWYPCFKQPIIQPELSEVVRERDELRRKLAEQRMEINLLDEIGKLLADYEYKGSYADAVRNLLEEAKRQAVPEDIAKDAERYRWIMRQAKLTDAIFAYLKSGERHVSNAIDKAMPYPTATQPHKD